MSLSSGLLGVVTGNSTSGISIPSFSNFSFGSERVYTSDQLVDSLTESADNILNAAKLVKCLYILFTDSNVATNAIGMIMASAMGVATQVASRIMSAFSNQINRLTMGVGRRVSSLLSNSFKLLVGILSIGYQIWDFIENIRKLSSDFSAWLGDVKDCEYMFAMIARCLLNKTLGNKITTMQNNIVKKINTYGDKINQKLEEEMQDVDTINDFLSKEVLLLNKAHKQLSNYNREIKALEMPPAKSNNKTGNNGAKPATSGTPAPSGTNNSGTPSTNNR